MKFKMNKWFWLLAILQSSCFALSGPVDSNNELKSAIKTSPEDKVRRIIPLLSLKTVTDVNFHTIGHSNNWGEARMCSGMLLDKDVVDITKFKRPFKYVITTLNCLISPDAYLTGKLGKRYHTFMAESISVYLPNNNRIYGLEFNSGSQDLENKELVSKYDHIKHIFIPPINPTLGTVPNLAILELDDSEPLPTSYSATVPISWQKIATKEGSKEFNGYYVRAYGWGADSHAPQPYGKLAGFLRHTKIKDFTAYQNEFSFSSDSDTMDLGGPVIFKDFHDKYALLGLIEDSTVGYATNPDSSDKKLKTAITAAVDIARYTYWITKIINNQQPKGTKTCFLHDPCILPGATFPDDPK